MDLSNALRRMVLRGIECLKPGVTRINYHYTIPNYEYDFLCEAIEFLAEYGYLFLSYYDLDQKTGVWCHKKQMNKKELVINITEGIKSINNPYFTMRSVNKHKLYKVYSKMAIELASKLQQNKNVSYTKYKENKYGPLSWFYTSI